MFDEARHSMSNTILRYCTVLIVGLVMLAGVQIAYAQDDPTPPEHEVTDDQVNAIAEQLYCPVCENIPLDVCGTQACADWRDEIRQMLHEGRSEAEIKAYFVERYGRRVLATPAVSGIDIVVWVLPFVVVVGGIGVLVVQLRRMAPHKAAAQEAAPAQAVSYEGLDPEYVERLERELREFVGQSG